MTTKKNTDSEQNRQILFNRIKNLISENPQGFTASADGKRLNLNKGYAVSITNNKSHDINGLINRIMFLNKDYGFNIGGWKDNQTNEFFLDLSIIEPSQIVALSIAKEFNQRAVFNFSNFNELRLN